MNENNRNDHMNGSPDSGIELRTPRNSVSSLLIITFMEKQVEMI